MNESRAEELDPAELGLWLAQTGWKDATIEALAGDVSTRRYFRLRTSTTTAVLALYPETLRLACARFLLTSELLREVKIPVPAILAADCERGFMLVSDVGMKTLNDHSDRPWSELEPYFDRALTYIDKLSLLSAEPDDRLLPPMGHEVLLRELRQTWETFLVAEGLVGRGAERATWWERLDRLCQRLGQRRPVPCHRDFMVRNLVPMEEETGALWVLDHQDLRLGPPFYDLASLLNDSLFPPESWVLRLLSSRLCSEFERIAYAEAAAQRTLKAVGTYCAFARRGMNRHLPLVRPTLDRAVVHLSRLLEFEPLLPAFRRRLGERSFC